MTFGESFGTERPRVIIIGLDGATFDVLRPMRARGEIPTLDRLLQNGAWSVLNSTLPVATLPAWTSFLTGASPAEHGVTDIFAVQPGTYGLLPTHGAMRTRPTFLEDLAAKGLSVASLGVPGTYPPLQLGENGLCVSGFDAPGAHAATAKSVWPPERFADIQRLGGWHYGTFNEFAPPSAERIVRAMLADIEQKERLVLNIYRERTWDVFFVHLQASDTVAHHLWHHHDAESPRHPEHPVRDAVCAVYRRLDRLIGNLLACAPDTTCTLVLSDHGMGGASDTAVYLNRWLHAHGYLNFLPTDQRRRQRGISKVMQQAAEWLPHRITGTLLQALPSALVSRAIATMRSGPVDFTRTTAFSYELDYAPAIWLNRKTTFPSGTVDDVAAEQIKNELCDELLNLCHPITKQPLLRSVRKREDVACGPHQERFPDLLIEPAWNSGYRASFLSSPDPGASVRMLSRDEYSRGKGAGMPGVHRREGVFIAHGPAFRSQALPPFDIAAAMEWVYRALEVPSLAKSADLAAAPSPFTPDEVFEVTERLRAMGYMG